MKRISVIAMIIMLAIPLAAQKRVVIGGPPEAPKDLPPLDVRKGMSDAEKVAALDRYVTALADKGLFSGTVLLARDGKPLLSRAVGLADREKQTPMTLDTKLNLGSINKLFTKIAIAQLAAKGKLALDDTVASLLPNLDIPSAGRITVEQLLEHRSGLGDFFGPQFMADPHRVRTLADYAKLFAGKPLEREPGSGNRYSNAGYIVLGLIIEAKSGMSYHDYVRKHIFAPAGMKDTDAYPIDAEVANRAIGYTQRGPEGPLPAPRPNTASMPGRGSSAGGGYSTAPDLLRFVDAFTSGKFVDAKWHGWLTQGELGAPAGPVGIGVAGGAPGVNAGLEIDGPWTLAVLANLDPPAASNVVEAWIRLHHPEGPPDGAVEVGPHAAPSPAAVSMPGRVVVPMSVSGHLPAFDVRVNGEGPFRFQLDTGAPFQMMVFGELAQKLELEKIGELQASDPSGLAPVTQPLYAVASLTIGEARFERLEAAGGGAEMASRNEGVSGVIGFALFSELLLTLDYPGGQLRIQKASLAADPAAMPLKSRNGVPAIEIEVAGRKMLADLDAGAPSLLTLPAKMAKELPLASEPVVVGRGRTISNEFDVLAAELNGDVRAGTMTLARPRLTFVDVLPFAHFGFRFLENYAVSFDSKNGLVKFVRGE